MKRIVTINLLDESKPFAVKLLLIRSKSTLNNFPSSDVAGNDPSCMKNKKHNQIRNVG
jgi:hypothetical protein